MKEKFLNNIKKFNMIKNGDRVIAAVSGGADSIFLLHNLIELKEYINCDLIVAHVNHGIRETALRDQEFVRDLSKKYKLDFELEKIRMDLYAKENSMTEEEAGRFLRYRFFNKIAGKNGKIFLAHNANDQVETLLQRVIRGTGIEGLAAMDYVANNLYRPMLDIKRSEIIDYLATNNYSFVEDETNKMDIYGRNKIRLNVIPYLKENFNPQVDDAILRLVDLSRENMNFIKELVDKYLDKNYKNGILNIKELRAQNPYFISEILREYLRRELGTIEGISRLNYEIIVQAIIKETSFKSNIVNNNFLEISYDSLYIKDEDKKTFEEEIFLKEGKNETRFGNFELEFNSEYKSGKNIISIDQDKIIGKLRLRYRKAGDKFVPFGMQGYKKLKDFFIDEKIEKYKRDKIAILTDDENIIWIVPYRMDNRYKLSRDSKNILNIKYGGYDD